MQKKKDAAKDFWLFRLLYLNSITTRILVVGSQHDNNYFAL